MLPEINTYIHLEQIQIQIQIQIQMQIQIQIQNYHLAQLTGVTRASPPHTQCHQKLTPTFILSKYKYRYKYKYKYKYIQH